MGDAFIVRRGSSGGAPFAAISVTYPSGSTCTCSNGVKTLTAKGTGGSYIFYVPEAGTWTVSCTDGTRTATKSVVINSQYQTESILLFYGLVLYDGTLSTQSLRECTAVTGGWHGKNADTYYSLGTFTSGASFIQISRTGAQAVTAETVNKIDLTLFSTLKVKVTQRQTNMRLCVNANTPMGYNTESYIDLPSTGEYSLDVSSLSGKYYVGIATWGEGANGANRFDRVVLE